MGAHCIQKGCVKRHVHVLRESPIFAFCHLYRELSLQQYGPLAGHELVINPINETQVSI